MNSAHRDSVIYRPATRPQNGPKDPRQDSPKQFQASARERLLDFLKPMNVHIGSVNSPSTNDFRQAFAAIYSVIDPGARIDVSSTKFNEDFEFVMRHVLKYPFAGIISKSCIATPTGSQNWPKIVSYFDWLIDLASLVGSMDLSSITKSDRPEAREFVHRVAIYNEVQKNANDDDIKSSIEASFQAENSSLVQELRQVQGRKQKLEYEIAELRAKPSPLTPLVEEKENLVKQLEQDTRDLKETEHRCKLAHESLQAVQADAKEGMDMKAKLEQQLADLEAQLQIQEISVDEAQRMAEQKDKLLDEQRVYEDRYRQEQDAVFTVDQQARTAKTEAMDAAERLRDSARKLALVPTATSELARHLGVDFERLVPGHGTRDLEILSARVAREAAHEALFHLHTQLQEESRIRKSDLAKVDQSILEHDMELSNLQKVGALLRKDKDRVDAQNKDAHDRFASASKRLEAETDALIEQAKRLRQETDRALYDTEDKVQRKRRELDDTEREVSARSALAITELSSLIDPMVAFPENMSSKLDAFNVELNEAIRTVDEMLRVAESEEIDLKSGEPNDLSNVVPSAT